MFDVQTEILPNSMFTYSKYRKDNIPDLKMQFDFFFNVIHKRLIKFRMVVLSDMWPRRRFFCELFLLFMFRVCHAFLPVNCSLVVIHAWKG